MASDLISQRLAGLGSFLQALVPELPDCRPDLREALATIPIGGLVSRLLGRVEESAGASGDIEFFGM